ncbi:MAG: Holliday junction DNA helicase RuvB C-terminal domain-containing protein [Sedimentisphaerales bacterium]
MEEKQIIGTDVNQVEITSLSHVKGQPQVQEVLRVSLDAYFANRINNENSSFGPVILLGPSGTGKTLTAKAIHCELANLKLIETNGEMLSNTIDIATILLTADNNTTIFIDESQALSTKAQHMLLTAISEKKLYLPRVISSKAQRQIPLANFSLILASTHEFQLQDALRNRMRICCRFDYYNLEDLTNIVKQRAIALKWQYESEDVLIHIASRAKQTPRLALNRNLQMAYNITSSNNRNIITVNDVIEAFRLLCIDELGLDSIERAYLKELVKHKSTKLNVIASKIGLPTQTISTVIEPYLLKTELIEKIGSDRCITDKGKEHINKNIV